MFQSRCAVDDEHQSLSLDLTRTSTETESVYRDVPPHECKTTSARFPAQTPSQINMHSLAAQDGLLN